MTSKNSIKIRLVVVDLAGTTVDYGSCAPAGAFVELFDRHGISITDEEARGPMGLQKRDHIVALSEISHVAQAWQQIHGHAITAAEIDKLYAEFIPLQLECLSNYGELIPGVLETVAELNARGIKVAATTGYNREMLEIVMKNAARQGFVPDYQCCADDVPQGRPAPWMIYRCMEALDVYPPSAVVSVGDTLPDVYSAINAGVWSVGVTKTGNMLGLSRAALESKTADEIQPLLEEAAVAMKNAGAHTTMDSFANILGFIDALETK